jgi:hypothetical protein
VRAPLVTALVTVTVAIPAVFVAIALPIALRQGRCLRQAHHTNDQRRHDCGTDLFHVDLPIWLAWSV